MTVRETRPWYMVHGPWYGNTGRATVDAKRHEQTKELAITLPSLEESDGCTMHMSKGMQKQTAIGPLVQIYLFSPLEDHAILLVLWASD